jgi:polysaccharide biosynthesis transport protein
MEENELDLLRRLAMSRQIGNGGNVRSFNAVNVQGETAPRGSCFEDDPGGSDFVRRSAQIDLRPLDRSQTYGRPGSAPSRSSMSHSAYARVERDVFPPAQPWPESATSTIQNELRAVLGMLRRRWRMILIGSIVGAVLAAAYAFSATPLFKGMAQIAVDPKRLSVLDTPDDRRRKDDPTFDPARVDSQVETAKSEQLARTVVKDLDLVNDPEFNGDDPSLLTTIKARIFGLFGGDAEPSPERKETATVLTVLGRLKVSRVDNTFVINVEFWSEKSARAAEIANAFADAYIRDQLNTNTDTSKRAGDWLKERLLEISAQSVRADTAVIDFKRTNNLAMADGKSIEDQALADLSAKLTEATANKNDAKARLDQIATVVRSQTPDLSVSDALRNEVINTLRQQYLENTQRATYLGARYGQNHNAVVRLRAENANILTSIKDELHRIEETYRSDYDVARGREEELRASLDAQFRKTVKVGEKQVKLAELEAAARAARQANDLALQRYLTAVQRQSFPVSDARVLSAATAPLKKDRPKRMLILAIGMVGGTMLGFAASIGAELSDRKLRTKRDAEQLTGVECLGFIPRMATGSREKSAAKAGGGPRSGRAGLPCNYVVKAPFSIGAEAIRGIKIAAERAHGGHGARVIGVISALPGEGKSSIAANLAHLIAHAGSMVLLIDGDLRSPSLSRQLAPGATAGLPDILLGQAARQSVTRRLSPLPLDFVPARTTLDLQQSDGILASAAMARLLDECRTQYAFIVIDLPPFVPVVDVKAAAHLIDGFVLVIEWGVTPRDVIGDGLAAMPPIWEKVFGSVLNKTALNQLKRYGEHVSYYKNKNYFKH